MAALTMTPSRQPFASLDTPRMRPFMRSKLNRQNKLNGAALSASSKNSIFIDDSENVDPNNLSLSAKRKRSLDDEDVSKGSPKPVKTSRIALTTREFNFSPRLSTPLRNGPSTPKSAPVLKPAGRSPPPKSSKPSGRHSSIAKPRPEASRRGVARPFSLAAALSQGKKAAPSPSPLKPPSKAPASWFFDIHVDTEQEEMTNLMQHSTGVLDISDDEGKASVIDGRGKENVPPAELGIDLPPSRASVSLAAATAARKASKMEEDRAPLGELAASDYYSEDCNAFSYTVVYDDDDENVPSSNKATGLTPPIQSTFVSPAIIASIDSVLDSPVPSKPTSEEEIGESDAKIEIWESSSAAGDSEEKAEP
ncbi:hypothetical protein N7532_007746 [Penicillium argentinense]|uniref:Thymidylate kinase n=1 Tax=Penicillium argentinense TaxID=1131581 RepID=A0A9W9EW39_9EURO|nr:uncharacterized protein N7532_007746 [Penicillium argentinense]KAJ5089062.1 hypothetical protein N7532_007746 [Penicillium argentinense]